MMDLGWIEIFMPIIATLLVAGCIGGWTLYNKLDTKLESIDSRLARVEGWIEGRFGGVPQR